MTDTGYKDHGRSVYHAQGSSRTGFTVIIEPSPEGKDTSKDTALPFSGGVYIPERKPVPEKLRKLRHMFDHRISDPENFYRQAVFMSDYEDDVPWEGDFFCYYPTYRDLTLNQLRGYFTWRAAVRKGEYQQIPVSAAYIYIYELLNGIGASSPEDTLAKIAEFEENYSPVGTGSLTMKQALRRWMFEFAVVSGLPTETAIKYADPELLKIDKAISVLKKPDAHTDDEVFRALCAADGEKVKSSPVITCFPEKGAHLFAEIWRAAVSDSRMQGKDLFVRCFGECKARYWYPLSNAVFRGHNREKDAVYVINECRVYRCRGGIWQEEACNPLNFDRKVLRGFMHRTDAALRRYLKTGHYLGEKESEEWATPYAEAVISADKAAAAEAARPKITIDLSGLDKIRSDAAVTRDSLLTEEEMYVPDVPEETEMPEKEAAPAPDGDIYTAVLLALLRGENADALIKEAHLMPSLAAEEINERLFDETGDNVIECENDTLTIVEDYREDLIRILGGI